MPTSLLMRLLSLLFSALFSTLAFANAGYIHFARGNVSATDTQGNVRALNKGDHFSAGDTINTGKAALAQMKFTDGALVSLQADSSFRVDEYHYNGKSDGSEKGNFSLLQGGLRTLTGAVGRQNRSNYKMNAVVATIGIRGTEYTAQLDDTRETLIVHTSAGVVEVCNNTGCLLLSSGETGRISANKEPQRTAFQPQLPPATPREETTGTVFSSSENRTPSGALTTVPHTPLATDPPVQPGNPYTPPSGPNYPPVGGI
ncbi:FecR domain-containing protein [Azonexus sp.]|uniref:FecR family protein n=1 Tax=Azonexus sp. TaxID=1872668 RepID=UPI0039E4A39E